jgi:hypothetical protein
MMNPRHVAALSLVGWYLVVPPESDLHASDDPRLKEK